MKKWISEIIAELKKFDLEVLVIICYSSFILLFSLYLKRTRIFFPNEPFFEKMLVLGIMYGISPIIPMILFKNKPEDYGVQIGNFKVWIKDILIIICIMIPVLLIAFKFTNLKAVYPLSYTARTGMNKLLIYEFVHLCYMFGWELFFRGFMLFGLSKKIDYKIAILIQTIPFALMHYRKPPLEAYGSIIAGIFLGIIAIRGKSFLPCAILHFLIAFIGDILGLIF
ncbi:MAG: CPBP family intramembrane metalloprotease [candidate division WOR-3 bacterium]|nr:CPBP family intramembrane metalloprotease [candidate division WOR-3 bacterium]